MDRIGARDEMVSQIMVALQASVYSNIEVFYQDDDSETPDTSKKDPWVSIRVQHISGTQRSLGGLGCRRFERSGYIEIKVYTLSGEGFTKADPLATILVDALEGQTTTSGIWFRAVRASEGGKSGAFQRTIVTADFEYDQVK